MRSKSYLPSFKAMNHNGLKGSPSMHVTPKKPLHLASFMTDEKQALRKILDKPLPHDAEVLGQCIADKKEIKTYKKESGFQRVDIKRKGQSNEESIHTFHYTNGLSQTVAESEKGEIYWLAMREKPAL